MDYLGQRVSDFDEHLIQPDIYNSTRLSEESSEEDISGLVLLTCGGLVGGITATAIFYHNYKPVIDSFIDSFK